MAQANENLVPLEKTATPKAGLQGNGATAAPPWWRHLLDPKWITLFVLASIVLPGMVYAFSRLGTAVAMEEHGEVSLGEFRFIADAEERSPVIAATFSLHLALIPETEAAARARLITHRYRVQQGVEQLLRQAHGGDFEDPLLGDFRRQLQEQINETLGIRAVADCIVTDLDLLLSGKDAVQSPEGSLAGMAPWND